MQTTITMATVFAVLIGLTACSDNTCSKYETHNGERDYCENNNGNDTATSYLDNGASSAPSKAWLTMDNMKKVLKFKKEYL